MGTNTSHHDYYTNQPSMYRSRQQNFVSSSTPISPNKHGLPKISIQSNGSINILGDLDKNRNSGLSNDDIYQIESATKNQKQNVYKQQSTVLFQKKMDKKRKLLELQEQKAEQSQLRLKKELKFKLEKLKYVKLQKQQRMLMKSKEDENLAKIAEDEYHSHLEEVKSMQILKEKKERAL